MTITTTLQDTTHAAASAATTAPRFDMYLFIHKALRQFMGHTLTRLGAMDVSDAEERDAVLDGVDSLLGFLRGHLQHENDFVHTAIEARRPGGARQTADDHLQHQDAIANLEDESRAVRDARDEHRSLLALRLYRHLADFVGENLQHMQVEETCNNAELWSLYSDEELVAIHDRLLATIGPDEMALTMRWMAAALNVQELAALFDDMRQKAPPPALEALLEVAHAQLDERRWGQLLRAIGRTPAPRPMAA